MGRVSAGILSTYRYTLRKPRDGWTEEKEVGSAKQGIAILRKVPTPAVHIIIMYSNTGSSQMGSSVTPDLPTRDQVLQGKQLDDAVVARGAFVAGLALVVDGKLSSPEEGRMWILRAIDAGYVI
jgi:hypothetical protein